MLMKKEKKILVGMSEQLYQQIVKEQYNVFKKENRHASIASLIRDALNKIYGNKKEE